MNAVVRDSETNLCSNTAGLIICPVPIAHHGIHFRVVDHIRIAVMIPCRGWLRIDRVRQTVRYLPVNTIVGCNNGRVFVNGNPHNIRRVDCPVAITIPRFVHDNNVGMCDLIRKMVAVFIIRGEILIASSFHQRRICDLCRKSSPGKCRRNQCEG